MVDDERSLRKSTAKFLERKGCCVLEAGDGKEALEVFRENRSEISIVLLDISMPVMDGLEAFHELRKLDPSVEVLLFSGYSPEGEVEKLIDEGAVGFLQKPVLPRELYSTLEKILTREG